MSDQADLAEVIRSLQSVVKSSGRGYAEYGPDAWVYGILVGWECRRAHEHRPGCDVLGAVARGHGWDEETVARLRRYRAAVREVLEGPVRPDEEPTT